MTMPAGEVGDAARARQEAADWFARLRVEPCEADLAAFRAWRAAHTLNGETYDRLARQWEQSKFLANTSLGRGRDLRRARASHRQPAARAAAVAAILLVIVASTLLLRPGVRSSPAAAIEIAGKGDAVRTTTLADGSRITLDRNSLLRVSFSASERHIELLKGRVRFDVAHDLARPFVVIADGGSVVAHGTIFDVELQPSRVRVVLLRGSVEVRGDAAAAVGPSRARMLAPGQALVVVRGKAPSPPVAADPADTNWASPMLSFDGTPLRDAVAGFNNRNGVKLALGSGPAGNLRVTGAFAADDPAGFAEAAAAMFGLDVRREKPDVISLH